MKTSWYSMGAAIVTSLMLVGCNNTPAEKAKERVEENKDAKLEANENKSDAEAERIKREAEMKKDQIDANAKANEAARDQAAENLDAAAEAKRREAERLEKQADAVKD